MLFESGKFRSIDLSLSYYPLDLTTQNTHWRVVINDIYLLNMLTTRIKIKNNSLFEFVYLFDVWVNLI